MALWEKAAADGFFKGYSLKKASDLKSIVE